MKKLLTLSLLLMLVVMCFALASCSGVDTDDVEENPLQVYLEATQNTPVLFFEDDLGVIEAMNDAINYGSISVNLSNPQLMGMLDKDLISLNNINATLFIDREDGIYGADASVNYNGRGSSASAYISPDFIGAVDGGLLGVNGSYSADIEELAESLPSTALGRDFGISAKEFAQFKPMIEEYRTRFNEILTNLEIPEENVINTALKSLCQSVTEEEITIGDEDIDCVVATYKITPETIKKALLAAINDPTMRTSVPQLGAAAMNEEIDEMIEEMKEDFNPDITIKIYLNEDENTFSKIDISGKTSYSKFSHDLDAYMKAYTEAQNSEHYSTFKNNEDLREEYYNYFPDYYYDMTGINLDRAGLIETVFDIPVSFTLTINETDVAIKGSATINGKAYGGSYSMSKSYSGDNIKYTVKASATMGAATMDVLSGSITHNQDSGSFNISASVDGAMLDLGTSMSNLLLDKDGKLNVVVSGTATDDDGATINISKASAGSFSLDIGLTVVFTPDEDAEEIEGTDIGTLTEDKAEDILDRMEDSVLVEIFDEIF